MHATNRARWRAPWLVVALAAIGVMALAIGVVHFAPSRCPRALLRAAVMPAQAGSAPQTRTASGEAVFYRPTSAGGRCSIAPLADDGLYASVPRSRYRVGALCGAYLDITGPLGTVRAEIVDMCPGCSDSQLDLSAAAFARIQLASRGTAQVTWQMARDPVLPSPIAIRVGPGSTASELALQVLNHGNPLAAVTIDGKPAAPRGDGYWIGVGDGPGPFQVQVTDIAGHTAVLTGITLTVDAPQQTSVQMYGGASQRPTPAPSPEPMPATPAPASAAASPPVSATAGQQLASGTSTC